MAERRSDVEVDVLIVGGGACGLTIGKMLSDLGVQTLVAERRPGTSKLPKAHYLNARTMEIFAQHGIAPDVYDRGTPMEQVDVTWYTSLGGDGPTDRRVVHRLDAFGGGGLAEYYAATSASPGSNLPQKHLEPLLRKHAEAANPGRVLFNHEVGEIEQDDAGVSATVTDRETGERIRVRARYCVGADGGRTVGPALGIALEGEAPFVSMIGIHFRCDLSAYLQEEHALIRRIVHLEDDGRLLQSGFVAMGPESWGADSEEWHVNAVVPFGESSSVRDEPSAVEHLRRVFKLPDLDPEIIEISNWNIEGVLAERYREGRVLLAGDAAHRHPPTTGLGLNSAVQDAHNLAWKLAAVLHGNATESLLDSYERERRPVARRNVDWALFTYFNTHATVPAWGITAGAPAEHNRAAFARLFDEGLDGQSRRARLREFLHTQRTEFQARDIELGYHYADGGAVVPDGTPAPPRDPMGGTYVPVARPGHRLPHAWLSDEGQPRSTHSLLEDGAFLLIAGANGADWLDAAATVAERTGVAITAWAVGGPSGLSDPADAWRELRGHGEDGVVLVRPDGHVGYRAVSAVADPVEALGSALGAILGQRDRGRRSLESPAGRP